LKIFFSKPKRLVDLVVWTHFLRYRRRAFRIWDPNPSLLGQWIGSKIWKGLYSCPSPMESSKFVFATSAIFFPLKIHLLVRDPMSFFLHQNRIPQCHLLVIASCFCYMVDPMMPSLSSFWHILVLFFVFWIKCFFSFLVFVLPPYASLHQCYFYVYLHQC